MNMLCVFVMYRVIYFLLFKCFHVIIVIEHKVQPSVHVKVVAAVAAAVVVVVAAAAVVVVVVVAAAVVSVFLLFCLRKLPFSHFHTRRIFIVF